MDAERRTAKAAPDWTKFFRPSLRSPGRPGAITATLTAFGRSRLRGRRGALIPHRAGQEAAGQRKADLTLRRALPSHSALPRPHNGIDWAARIGTPVLAAGDGEVIDSGVRSGFGRHIEIRHAEGFVTTYSHLDRIGAGITAGKRVQRGDVIGTLGQSGLATGPHLHFEFKLNGVYVDPLAIRIPRPPPGRNRPALRRLDQPDQPPVPLRELRSAALTGPARLSGPARDDVPHSAGTP